MKLVGRVLFLDEVIEGLGTLEHHLSFVRELRFVGLGVAHELNLPCEDVVHVQEVSTCQPVYLFLSLNFQLKNHYFKQPMKFVFWTC